MRGSVGYAQGPHSHLAQGNMSRVCTLTPDSRGHVQGPHSYLAQGDTPRANTHTWLRGTRPGPSITPGSGEHTQGPHSCLAQGDKPRAHTHTWLRGHTQGPHSHLTQGDMSRAPHSRLAQVCIVGCAGRRVWQAGALGCPPGRAAGVAGHTHRAQCDSPGCSRALPRET